MFTLSPAAAEAIVRAADSDPVCLRIAAKIDDDGELVYGMGFDDEREDDLVIESHGLILLIAPPSQPHLETALLDFVEVHAGEYQFVFSQAGTPADGGGGNCGSGGCGSCGGPRTCG